MTIIRYLFTAVLQRKPTESMIRAAIGRVAAAAEIESINELLPLAWSEGNRWSGGQLLLEGYITFSGKDRLVFCEVASAEAIDEKAVAAALKRSLKGEWREVRQDSTTVGD